MDRKVLLGIGIGLILGCVIASFGSFKRVESNNRIEEKARDMGMHYSNDCKVIFKGDEEK